MAKFKKYQQWQIDFIKENSEGMTLKELSNEVKLPISSIYAFCRENNISTKHAHGKIITEEKKKSISRPAAVYTQLNSIYGIANSCNGVSLTANKIK